MIFKCWERGLIKGLGCRDENNVVTNLQYADDTLIFEKDCLFQASVLKWILICYKRCPGLKINFYKSLLIFLGEVTPNNQLISQVFNCQVHKFPINYLGLPLLVGRLKKSLWNLILIRFRRDCQARRVKLLSLGGRIAISSPLISSHFPLPRWVEREIDSLRRKFLWKGANIEGKGFSLVN